METTELYSFYLKSKQVCTDTRKITQDCIFFALKGGNFDGNQFAAAALDNGAAYAVVDDSSVCKDERYLLVPDVLEALQSVARHHRRKLGITVLGITGSNGKTTSKELIREVLDTQLRIQATKGNLNNHIGVPLTLLELTEDTELAVVEMGANHPYEIGELSAICEPNFGIITNIGKAHLEGFGGYQGVINTKKELYDHVRANNGEVFVNKDDALLMELSEGIKRHTFGTNGGSIVGKLEKADPFVTFSYQDGDYQSPAIPTQLVGTYNLSNMLAAVAIGKHFGVTHENITKALAAYAPTNNRSQVIRTKRNTLIMDAYNANPTSMGAALENFGKIEADNKFFVLGDMLELGDESEGEHQQMVAMARELGLTEGIFVGAEFGRVDTSPFLHFTATEDAIEHLKKSSLSGHTILIKGSRGIRLETTEEVL